MDHAFSFPIRHAWIAPYLRKVGGQREDRRALLLIEQLAILGALLFTDLLCFCQQFQLAIPVCLEGIGYQAVIRIHAKIAASRALSVIACPLHLLLPQPVGFIQPRLKFLPYRQRYFERDGCDRFDEEVSDRLIDGRARNMLTDWFPMFDAFALIHVIRSQLSSTAVISHGHALATAAADQQSLHQSGAFSRRTPTAVFAIRLAVVAEAALVLLILFPVDITGVRSPNQHFPFFSWHCFDDPVAFHSFAHMGSSVNESARVSGIVEDAQRPAMFQPAPYHVPLVCSGMDMPWKLQSLFSEVLYGGHR